MAEALVAGHICLDIIPELGAHVVFEPGRLIEAGPALLSTGGAVSNTGLALTHLGVETRLLGKIGRGPFGDVIRRVLDHDRPGIADSLIVVDGEATSYTIVINVTGQDRTFLHCPGCNNTFTAADVSDEALREVRLMHFGYPPLMAQMFADGGRELETLFRRAKEAGCTTSLDMSLPDAEAPSGQADWQAILKRVLPYVDVFVPSIEELLFMLERPTFETIRGAVYSTVPGSVFRRLADKALGLGAQMVGIKAGSRGLYLKTRADLGFLGRAFMMNHVDVGDAWRARELWAPCFKVELAGTTGAGDATIGGFLMGVMRGMSPEKALTAGVAAGACCCERPDAVSGVRSWEETRARVAAGWDRLPLDAGKGWTEREMGVLERVKR
ncbi:MAG: carbohydrate kinase family protein [Fimbriimonas sp.]